MTTNIVAGLVLVSLDGALVSVTLNRPERNNGLDAAMKEALVATRAEIADDDDVRARRA